MLEARGLHTYYGSSHVLQGVDFTGIVEVASTFQGATYDRMTQLPFGADGCAPDADHLGAQIDFSPSQFDGFTKPQRTPTGQCDHES